MCRARWRRQGRSRVLATQDGARRMHSTLDWRTKQRATVLQSQTFGVGGRASGNAHGHALVLQQCVPLDEGTVAPDVWHLPSLGRRRALLFPGKCLVRRHNVLGPQIDALELGPERQFGFELGSCLFFHLGLVVFGFHEVSHLLLQGRPLLALPMVDPAFLAAVAT